MNGWGVLGIVAAVVALLALFPLLSWWLRRSRRSDAGTAIGTAFEAVDAVFNPGKQRPFR